MIGNVGLASEWDGHDLDCLVVIQRFEDEGVEVFDVYLRTAGGGGLSGTIGQVLS
jgi:hypothetical protein